MIYKQVKRFRIACVWKLVVICCLLYTVVVMPTYYKELLAWQLLNHQVERGRAIIQTWIPIPESCAGYENEWYMSVDALNSFFGNVCYADDLLSQAQLECMVDKLEVLNERPVTIDTLGQAYDTIASSSKATHQYARRMRVLFDQHYLPLRAKVLNDGA